VSNCAFAGWSGSAVATESAVASSRVEELNKVKKVEDAGRQVNEFLFRGSTDPAAKKRFFLKRFTFFQQG
jgi:hypothetical protein